MCNFSIIEGFDENARFYPYIVVQVIGNSFKYYGADDSYNYAQKMAQSIENGLVVINTNLKNNF